MKNLILFDDDHWKLLLPLSYTRPVSEMRVGILSIREKWEINLGLKASYITQDFLSEKYPIKIDDDNLIIMASLLPNEKILKLVRQLENNEALLHHNDLMAARLDRDQFDRLINNLPLGEIKGLEVGSDDSYLEKIIHPEDLFTKAAQEIKKDFKTLTSGKDSQPISDSNFIRQADHVFVENGAVVENAVLNASQGPIYIGKDAEVMEGSLIRGPFAMGVNSTLKMGTKIYGPTIIGSYCKIGGEVKNSVIHDFSNKSHDGYLGNSVIGEWCNLGADTNTSNLKNNYTNVKLWDYEMETFRDTGTQFCGLIMGDHSKCGINTMFNTGTVVGVSANIFGSGFPRNFIPSFSWGGPRGYSTYIFEKAISVNKTVVSRRGYHLTDIDEKILKFIFHMSSQHRIWEG